MTIKALCITEDLDRPTTALFIKLRAAGIDLRVICPAQSRGYDVLVRAGVPVSRVAIRRQIDFASIRGLRQELLDVEYDIMHVFSNKALQNGLIAARGLPVKIVAYRGIVGNVSFFSPVSWMRFLNPRIDRIVCVAEAVRRYFLEMRPQFLRVPSEKLVTIYKGHDLAWYEQATVDLRQLGVRNAGYLICCVSNYRPRKGIEWLVDAVSSLPSHWQAHLLLVGDMDAESLNRRIEGSSARSRIHRLGRRDDAPAIAAACDVFVLPSIKREGLSRALIEAMACGVAPVVTGCGGSPELVVHRQSGLVVPPRDVDALAGALAHLYRYPDLRRRFGKAARARIAEHFNIDDTVRKTLELYRELATGASRTVS